MKVENVLEKLEKFITQSRAEKNLECDDLPDWEDGYDACLEALQMEIQEIRDGDE